jgi:ABC-type branched-subunit amino acid transport system substrate-binding protein
MGHRLAPRRALGTALVLLLVAGCGARWSDEERAAVFARGSGEGSASESEDGGSGGAEAVGGSGGTDGSVAVAGDVGGTTGGSKATGGTGGSAGPSGPRPCAPSTAPGVTDDTITVGSISTLSGPVPGLGESSQRATQAYVAYVNATGGVCGRQVVLKTADDGYETSRNRAIMTEFTSKALGIVGGLAAGDGGSVDVVRQTGMPVVSIPTSQGFNDLPTVFDTNPSYANNNAPTGKTRYLHEQGVRTAAYVYVDIAQAHFQIEEQQAQVEATGIEIVLDLAVPLSTLSWDSAARAVANSKADYVFFLHDAGADAAFARSLDQAGYAPKFEEYLTAYGSDYIERGGAAVEGTTSWIRTLPTEDGGKVAEQAKFSEWMDRAAPGIVKDTWASDAWAAAKAFFDSLGALPGPITREALVAHFRSIGTYDAGGFLGPIQFGKKLNNGCLIGMVVRDATWRRLTPASGFLC